MHIDNGYRRCLIPCWFERRYCCPTNSGGDGICAGLTWFGGDNRIFCSRIFGGSNVVCSTVERGEIFCPFVGLLVGVVEDSLTCSMVRATGACVQAVEGMGDGSMWSVSCAKRSLNGC